ncbi:MAG: hypothetical protein NDI69_02260 [Bacteriovoracaceae bacterium]|nr:hypothetical protein [Bacteriovoracaceae bacterium]
MKENLYSLFASALCYPEAFTRDNAKELEAELNEIDAKYAELIRPYMYFLGNETMESLEEAYTNTFDIQAVCPLEIGYTLFGEDYKRGEFLVRMSELHKEHNTPLVSSELGDYLPNVLLLLERMPDGPFKKDFIEKILMPAMGKMLKNFDEKKDANPFSLPLRVMNAMLASSYTLNPKILEARYE